MGEPERRGNRASSETAALVSPARWMRRSRAVSSSATSTPSSATTLRPQPAMLAQARARPDAHEQPRVPRSRLPRPLAPRHHVRRDLVRQPCADVDAERRGHASAVALRGAFSPPGVASCGEKEVAARWASEASGREESTMRASHSKLRSHWNGRLGGPTAKEAGEKCSSAWR